MVIIFTTMFVACRKDNEIVKETSDSQFTRGFEIKQKTYNISSRQTREIIERFKNSDQQKSKTENSAGTGVGSADSLAIDSALFVIEAALNFDLTYRFFNDSNYRFVVDSCEITMPSNTNNNKVRGANLEAAYNKLADSPSTSINETKKLFFTDISAYGGECGNVILHAFTAYKILTFVVPCSVPSTPNIWSADSTFYTSLGSGWVVPDALTALNQRLNCVYVTRPCYSAYYRTNIVFGTNYKTSTIGGNSIVFTSDDQSAIWHTNSANMALMSSSQLNTYLVNQRSLYVNWPFPPYNPSVFRWVVSAPTNNPTQLQFQWVLIIYFATIQCYEFES